MSGNGQALGGGQAAGANAKRLSIRNLNKSFGSVHVVKDLTLDVEPGEFLVLLGPSGCGKTTALRMVAGLEEVDSGSIHLGETDVTRVLPKYRDVAMVFQSYALYPHKTVAENIGFPLKVRGVAEGPRAEAVRDAASQVRMDTLLERYPRQLSGGQRQRVALARAIIRRPSAFLMDEPLSNLDAKLRGYMRAELKHMQHELGVTTVYVTHDQIEAMTLAHRVAIINHGVLQQLGTPRDVYNNPANLFVAGFMGSPPMNFIEGGIEDGRFRSHDIDLSVSGEARAGKATLGFRPEDATVVAPGEGLFDGRVYTAELTGEQTLVTVQVGEAMMAIKMPKDYDVDFDTTVGVRFPFDQGFLFDTESGERIAARTVTAA
ncbi:MAG: ABC transporter ATP-binding protein [Dongiaceae bacterium]